MTSNWEILYHTKRKPTLNKPILIEGLPGIGSVGKIAVDFIIEDLKAKKLLSFSSHAFPPSVFVNEKNLVELPSIELYYKKTEKNDFLFLSGDLQPVTEEGCHTFAEHLLSLAEEYGVRHVLTLGGIALNNIPKNPQIFCTGNDEAFITRFRKGTKLNHELYGVIGPIIGVSGLLLGLAKKRGIPAMTLLVETYAHPMYLGIDGTRELLKILDKKLKLNIDLKSFEEEIATLQKGADKGLVEKGQPKIQGAKRINYIG